MTMTDEMRAAFEACRKLSFPKGPFPTIAVLTDALHEQIYAHAWNAALEAVAVLEDTSARQDKGQSLKFFRDGDRFRGLLYDGSAQIHEASARRCRTLKGSAP